MYTSLFQPGAFIKENLISPSINANKTSSFLYLRQATGPPSSLNRIYLPLATIMTFINKILINNRASSSTVPASPSMVTNNQLILNLSCIINH